MADFTCGYCGRGVSTSPAIQGLGDANRPNAYRCPLCKEISAAAANGAFYPPYLADFRVAKLPADVEAAWHEATKSFGIGAYTACEIMCRKILMHIAVDVAESEPGKSFVSYVNDLESEGYITKGLKGRVDEIRSRGNVANHELPSSSQDVARKTMTVTRHLLISIYEMADD